ncbi:hypothetical protein SPI_09316 [Niveomyces insectorum RCEF 264]|uniref:Uncharacterized protein n=1 Tax=Niveomyces insectorum RCEF 264 TaxID=1081102 RepID=A0A167LWQ2_9HYPO|nr:hypothetical protein SPI_09316 [Niveomyces insectorum RCEF 264]
MVSGAWSTASKQFAAQWTEPGDIFSVLLILGGDVVLGALAAVTGGGPVTAVAFSFGWVAYAVSALVSAIGDSRLMSCAPEVSLKVFNLQSGYQRQNQSWLLARLLKTYDAWMPDEVKARLYPSPSHAPRRSHHRVDVELGRAPVVAAAPETKPAAPAPPNAALCVAVYRWRNGCTPGVPARDLVWWSGYAVSLVQLGIAAIPMGLHRDWSIFLATAAGTLLAYTSASLPQWGQEKWNARRTPKDVAITVGNGTRQVVVVQGANAAGQALDLEDLAAGQPPDTASSRLATTALTVLWLVLLITCTGIQVHTWYLLAVGGIGMLHNIVVAGAPRSPAALGLPIELARCGDGNGDGDGDGDGNRGPYAVFAETKVMWTLMKLEEQYKGYGKALLPEFFPGELRKREKDWWASNDADERRQLFTAIQEEVREKAERKRMQQQELASQSKAAVLS